MLNIADRHLRPTRHADGCDAEKCVGGCPIHEYEADMARPVLMTEMAAARREEERWQALARGDFSHPEGAGHADG